MDHRIYWIWLQHAVGAGSSKPKFLMERYRDICEFYQDGSPVWRLLGIFTPKEMERLCSFSLEDAEKILQTSEKRGHAVLAIDQEEYPEALKEIDNPPCVLYCKGEFPDFNRLPALAIVGTRKATQSGRRVAHQFAYELAKTGMIIVSGGALGIDAAAHQGALAAQGKTVCVLGCGIDYPYLAANASLREVIARTGALITEYPPGTQPSKTTFPIRNRIISGITQGTLVVEAAGRSGSLITADSALEQNREVFAVPTSLDNPVSLGVNTLLKDGAAPVTSPGDIIEVFASSYPQLLKEELPVEEIKTERMVIREILEDTYSGAAKKVYACLREEPCHMLEITEKTGLSVRQILTAVTELELGGKIEAHSGRRYSLPR